MELHLQGKVAVVTGGARGIGESIASHLAAEGCQVIIADTQVDRAMKAVENIGADKCRFVEMDVTDLASIDKAFKEINEIHGQVDILVNNAGISKRVQLINMSFEDLDQVFKVNTYGTFFVTKAVLPQMLERQSGKIINIAAMAGKEPLATYSHYCASKAAVLAFTKAIALEHAGFGLNINSVCPGAVDTRLWSTDNLRTKDRSQTISFRHDVEASFSFGRAQKIEDVANMVCYLASDLTKDITGQSFNITS